MTPDPTDPKDPGRAGRPFNYLALVGAVFVLIIAIALINTLRSEDSGTLGIGSYGVGKQVPPFAVPIATSDLDGDANVDPEKACEIDEPDALRICDYFDRPLVISFWFTKAASSCIDHQDIFDRLLPEYGDRVGLVSINVRDDRDRVRELIAEHDWKIPVGYDRDGAVSNIYRVGGCPTFAFVKRGGVLKNAEIGDTTFEELDTQVRSLLESDGTEVKPTKTKP